MSDLPKHKVLWRDWKEQIEAKEIDSAIQQVFDGKNVPRLYDADTGQDAYAIVISASEMTPEQVQEAYDADCLSELQTACQNIEGFL